MELLSPITSLKGVGEKTTKLLNKLGVYTIGDMLLFFPRTYLQYPKPVAPDENSQNQIIALYGRVKSIPKTLKTSRMDVTSCVAFCNDIPVEMVWFRSSYIKKVIEPGKGYVFYGRLLLENGKFKLKQPEIFTAEKYTQMENEILPIYNLTKGLSNNLVTKEMRLIFDEIFLDNDRIPQDIISRNGLMDYSTAIREFHFPSDYQKLVEARRRLAFEELFFFILNTRLQENNNLKIPTSFDIKRSENTNILITKLPFELTPSQQKVLEEVRTDLSSGFVTQRLIQGDVGSGKTIIAFLAMLDVCSSGYNAAIMAPTEVLARQHFETFSGMCKHYKLDYEVVLFTGSMKKAEKNISAQIVESGKPCFIIGTQALISEGRDLGNVALVITDEQHRFGVKQREALLFKGANPHMIVMSATPIPRTLAMILYGNMLISTIDELPSNRLPIKTCVIKEKSRKTAYKFISDEITAGHQVYVICPLVEASETNEAENVCDYKASLDAYFNGKYKIGILHGRMKPIEKNEIMDLFSRGEIDILVSTTVVEVGVNVPNATVIMVENANRFGLAQLHQLRGRVGRGKYQSYCILMNGDNSLNNSKRLDIMNKSNDGFYIASEDLKLRGPGDLFGIKQSGDFNFKVADIYNDAIDLKIAAEEVDELLKKDPNLDNYAKLRSALQSFIANQSYVL